MFELLTTILFAAISIDCPALLSFASGLGMRTRQAAMYNSLNTGDCCNKNGVACTGSRVTSITWSGLSLNGNINGTALNLLASLTFIEMNINSITGQLPKSLPDKITHINIGANQLSGPITSLPSGIQYFHCDQNSFSGVFPRVADTMDNMNIIVNQFSGPIYLKSPSVFMMQYSQISRVYIEDTSKLRLGSAYDSSGFCEMGFSQVYTTQIAYLTGVCQVSGSYNTNTECGVVLQIATDLNMSSKTLQTFIGNCCLGVGVTCDMNSHVTEINWSNMQLNGSLDTTKIELLYSFLQSFNISNNNVTGTLSFGFNSNILSLDLSRNKMSGNIGNLVLNKLKSLNLNRNQFNGSLATFPPVLSTLILSNNNFTGSIPQVPLTINVFNISRNNFSGNISLSSPYVVDISGNLINDISFMSAANLQLCSLQQNPLIGSTYPSNCVLKDPVLLSIPSITNTLQTLLRSFSFTADKVTIISTALPVTASKSSITRQVILLLPSSSNTTVMVTHQEMVISTTATIISESPLNLHSFTSITFPITFLYLIKVLGHFIVSATVLIQVISYLSKRGFKKSNRLSVNFRLCKFL